MDDALFQQLMQAPAANAPTAPPVAPPVAPAAAPAPTPAPPAAAPGAPAPGPEVPQAPGGPTDAEALSQPIPGYSPEGYPTGFLGAAAGGAAKAIFETKDFLTGSTPEADKSGVRKWIEQGTEAATKDSTVNAIGSTISQFATGMLGAGKILGVARLAAPAEAIVGTTALSSAKAAAVGAAAFDPHQGNIANMAENIPVLGGPLFGWMAVHPDDSVAAGRLKNALTSIGVDITLQGLLLGAGKVYKLYNAGDHAGAVAATEELKALPGHTTVEINGEAVPSPGAPPLTDHMAAFEANQARVTGAPVERPDLGMTVAPDYRGVGSEAKPPVVETREDILKRMETSGSPADQAYAAEQRAITASRKLPTDGEAPVGPAEAPVAPEAAPGAPPTPRDQAVTVEAPGVPAGPTEDQARLAAAREGSMGGPAGSPALSGAPSAAERAVPLPKVRPLVRVTAEDAKALIASTRSDLDAIDAAGSVQGAIEEGHPFADGAGIPWNKLNLPGEVDDFVARVAEQLAPEIAGAKGGAVLTDASVMRQVQGMANYFNINPSVIVARIQEASEDATKMVANMNAAYVISDKMHQEAFLLADRIGLGDIHGYATEADAILDFQRQVTLAASMFASGQSMRAAFGRGMRQMRSEFAIPKGLVNSIQDLGGERLMQMYRDTLGDPKKLAMVTNPSFLKRALSEFGFIVQNNLLWGSTLAVKTMSDAFLMVARPAERIVGSGVQSALGGLKDVGVPGLGWVDNSAAAATRSVAIKQYGYLATSWIDGLPSMINALKTADSVLASTGHGGMGGEAATAAMSGWRPWDSPTNVLYNAYYGGSYQLGLRGAIGTPTRLITGVTELMQQNVYRSTVLAHASVEADAAGLVGKDATDYIQTKLANAFDEAGHGTDKDALQEALTSTLSQPLLPGTKGRDFATLVSNHPDLRLVVPFTHVPMNIFRYSVKYTPGANMLQEEYRNMFIGRMGPEKQAQAMGQMAIMGVAIPAMALSALNMTGAGPQDPKVRQEYLDTGWKPYSAMTTLSDGRKLYSPVGRVEPFAAPFALAADIHDYINMGGDASKVQDVISSLGFSIMTQVGNKLYLGGINKLAAALTDPRGNLTTETASIASMMIPFSSAFRNYNQDPFMREARTVMDKLMAGLPGLSATLPPKYDGLGQPVRARTSPLYNPGFSVQDNNPVDQEVARMAALGYAIEPPSPTIPHGHVDLRDIKMVDGKDAYAEYQRLAGQLEEGGTTLKKEVEDVMASDEYKMAPDGYGDVIGTKLNILDKVVMPFRHAAEKIVLADDNVREAAGALQQKAANAYQEQQTPQVGAQTQWGILGKIGQMFGQSMSPTMPKPPQ